MIGQWQILSGDDSDSIQYSIVEELRIMLLLHTYCTVCTLYIVQYSILRKDDKKV